MILPVNVFLSSKKTGSGKKYIFILPCLNLFSQFSQDDAKFLYGVKGVKAIFYLYYQAQKVAFLLIKKKKSLNNKSSTFAPFKRL